MKSAEGQDKHTNRVITLSHTGSDLAYIAYSYMPVIKQLGINWMGQYFLLSLGLKVGVKTLILCCFKIIL